MAHLASWDEFSRGARDLAAAGERLLLIDDTGGKLAGGLAYLATVRRDGGPRVHPISPALVGGKLYAFILRSSQKRDDLLRDGRYALHSFPYPMDRDLFTDEEFYLLGRATPVDDSVIRHAVADAVGDNAQTGDVFELKIERALHKHRPEGAAVYARWKAEIATSGPLIVSES